MKICKHMKIEFAQMNDKKHQFDIVLSNENGRERPRSFRGYWFIPDMPICLKFQGEEEQYNTKQGFWFCDRKKCEKCVFFKEEEI